MGIKGKLGLVGACLLALVTLFKIGSTWGQSAPALSISMTNANNVFLVVTNGTNSAKYDIFWTEFLGESPDWQLVTNGGTGVTNFTVFIGDDTQGFFLARNNTNVLPFMLNLTVAAPANGANIQ